MKAKWSESLVSINEWVRRKQVIGCPCDYADSSKCDYANPAKAGQYPCPCTCHALAHGFTEE